MDSVGFDISELFKLFGLKKVILLFLGFYLIGLLSNKVTLVSETLQKKFTSRRLLILKLATVISFSLYIVGSVFLIYSVLKPPKELLIAIGGSAAVAVGFALKDIISSIIAGFILLFDRPFQVGDRVNFGDVYGEVTKIGLRTVRLNTLDDNLVTIPNSKFVTDVVSSGNAGALDMMVVATFNLSLNTNLKLAEDVLKEVVATSRFAYLKKPISIVFNEENQGELFWMKMTVKAYVLDVRYEKAFLSDIIVRGNEAILDNRIDRPQKIFRTLPV